MPILKPPGQLRPDPSDPYGLLALVSNVNNYCVNLINLTQSGTDIDLTGPQTFTGVVRLVGTASNNFTVTLPATARLIDALGPTISRDGSYGVPISIQNEDPSFTATLTAGDASTTLTGTMTIAAGTRRIFLVVVGTVYDPTVLSIYNIGTFTTAGGSPGSGTVTSVGQTVPVEFTISGSPITGSGVLGIGKANESPATFWAGPTTGSPAQPTFRAIALSDLPSGFVTSVGLTMPGEFTVSGSPVTSTGTLAVAKATEPANTVWAGPTSGSPAQPTFRALVAADLPSSLALAQTFATINNESATLTNSRQLVAGANITFTDLGAGSTLTIAASGGGSGGTLQAQTFTSSGTFTPETGVTGVWISAQGGGGGGSTNAAAASGSGGGSGEFCEMAAVNISGAITVTIGAAGAGAPSGTATASGSNGGNTTFGTLLTCLGGFGGTEIVGGSLTRGSGAGGGPRGGAAAGASSTPGAGAIGAAESPSFFGGSSGGGGSNAGSPGVAGGSGGSGPGFLFGAAGGTAVSGFNGGGGGGTSIKGLGATGGNGQAAGNNATANTGAGGGGAGATTSGTALAGGNGGSGWLTVFWIG